MTDPRGSGGWAAAGWYPDAGGSGRLRFWDGSAWTDHWADPPQQPPAPPAPPAAPPPPPVAAPPFAAPPFAAPPQPPPPLTVAPGGQWIPPASAPPKSGTSGCLKAALIVLVLIVLAGGGLLIAAVAVGNRVVHHLATDVSGTPGRPRSLPSSASGYTGERTQDQVAGPNGMATIGSLNATARDWARTTVPGTPLVCGDVAIHRAAVSTNNPFDLALQLGGTFDWELVPPSGSEVSFDVSHSSLGGLTDYLTGGQIGDAAGKVCFPDPGGRASSQ